MTTQHKNIRDVFRRLLQTPTSVFFLDGGTGEELFRQGVPDDRKIWSAAALVHSQHHSTLQKVHESFLSAGSDAITTNSYGVVPGVGFDDPKERAKYIHLSGEIARKAVIDVKSGGFVFGSLGPLIESYRADMIKPHTEGVLDYIVACRALHENVDAFLAETMSCIKESKQPIEAISRLEDNEQKPVLVSFALAENGNFRDGQDVPSGLKSLLQYSKEQKVDLLAILFNCAKPEAITFALETIQSNTELCKDLEEAGVILGAYANRLSDIEPNWTLEASEEPQPFRQDLNPDQYLKFVERWIGLGAKIVGGCCGITPEHIARIRTAIVI